MDKNNYSKRIKLKQTKIDDSFWFRKTELVRNEIIPYQLNALNDKIDEAEKSYCLENFRKAAEIVSNMKKGIMPKKYPEDRWEYRENECDDGSFHGWVFQDSDLYKWLEAVSYCLINHPDKSLEEEADECIDLICAAQLDNGYLDTLYIINDIDKAFSNLKDKHELYCFGHMAQACCAYLEATGKKKFFNACCKFADLICDIFNENGKKGYPGHEIAEMGLIELYRHTGCKKYLDTALFFINQRGTKPYYFDKEQVFERTNDSLDYYYNQAHIPPVCQKEAVGHAVRAVYLYSGMADAAKETDNESLYNACESIFDNIINKKMYITGGIGATVDGEAFSFNYDLPNDLAYCETCASIGLIFFAQRMLEIKPDSKYADTIERALYNTVLSGMSEDGKSFFYVNPLEVLPEASHKDSRKRHIKPTRQKWFSCACCPPNLARLISSIGEYCLTENEKTVFINQYIGGSFKTNAGKIRITSHYTENGRVTVETDFKDEKQLALRIPGWCKSFKINRNYKIKNGYAYINTNGRDKIEIEFEIKIKLIKCSNRVRQSIGKAAVTRGPFIYCMEEADNGADLHLIRLAQNPCFSYNGGFITAKAYREKPDTQLYTEYKKSEEKETEIKLIEYYLWGNRGENEMTVYIRV